MSTVILDGLWCPHPWGHGPQLLRGRAVTGLWWAREPTSLRHSPADSYVSEGGSSPPGVSVYFEDGFAVQPLTHTPCGVRGCGDALQLLPRHFFGVRPPIMPLRLSEAEGGCFPAFRFGFAPDRQHYRRTFGASRLCVPCEAGRPAVSAVCSISLPPIWQ